MKSPNPVMNPNPNPNPKIESYLVTMSWFTENKRALAGAHGAGPAQNCTPRRRPALAAGVGALPGLRMSTRGRRPAHALLAVRRAATRRSRGTRPWAANRAAAASPCLAARGLPAEPTRMRRRPVGGLQAASATAEERCTGAVAGPASGGRSI